MDGQDTATRGQPDGQDKGDGQIGVVLLFRAGERPTGEQVARLMQSSQAAGSPARISHRPEPQAGWLEILVSGLTFDIRGLAPSVCAPVVDVLQRLGFGGDGTQTGTEAIEIVPARHVAAGAELEPVLRVLVGLAANLALNLPVTGVLWQGRTLMEPRFFARMALNWSPGKAFPAA